MCTPYSHSKVDVIIFFYESNNNIHLSDLLLIQTLSQVSTLKIWRPLFSLPIISKGWHRNIIKRACYVQLSISLEWLCLSYGSNSGIYVSLHSLIHAVFKVSTTKIRWLLFIFHSYSREKSMLCHFRMTVWSLLWVK